MKVKHLASISSCVFLFASTQVLADNFVGGDETTTNRLVPSAVGWTQLVGEPIVLADDDTSCVVTGSADALNPNVFGNNQYRFSLSLAANPANDTACERTVSFDNGAVQTKEEVSSTCTFRHLNSGVHQVRWLAKKQNAGAANLIVTDNSMTITCMNNLQDFDGEEDGF